MKGRRKVPFLGQKKALAMMNEKHAVVCEGGKTVVLREEVDPVLKRRCVTRSSFPDIEKFYQNLWVPLGEDKSMPLGKWWLNSRWTGTPGRR